MEALKIEKKKNITFSALLTHHLRCSAERDYIAARCLLNLCGGFLLWQSIVNLAAASLEKIMKAFLMETLNEKSDVAKKYNHRLDRLRLDCAKTDSFYENSELKSFCEIYTSGKGNELFRYGFLEETGTVGVNLEKIIALMDKFYLGTILKIGPISLAGSQIANLLCNTPLTKSSLDQLSALQVENIKNSLKINNAHLHAFIGAVDQFYAQFDQK